MTTEAEFKRLKALAIADPTCEPAMLTALLNTQVYVHVPLSATPERTHLVCWDRPDGLRVIPFFSDLAGATAANGPTTRIAQILGRDLFRAAPGATFMLDPNETSLTLYPEEVSALLDEGRAIVVSPSFHAPDLDLSAPEADDRWLLTTAAGALDGLSEAKRVHLAAARPGASDGPADRLLVIVCVPSPFAERAARAIGMALQASGRDPRLPVDLTTYGPDEVSPRRQAAELDQGWTLELS